MRSVNSRSIGSWQVAKIFKHSELPSASRTVNPSARSVLTQINRIDGSSSTTRMVLARDGGIGGFVSMRTFELGQIPDWLRPSLCLQLFDTLHLYRVESWKLE